MHPVQTGLPSCFGKKEIVFLTDSIGNEQKWYFHNEKKNTICNKSINFTILNGNFDKVVFYFMNYLIAKYLFLLTMIVFSTYYVSYSI